MAKKWIINIQICAKDCKRQLHTPSSVRGKDYVLKVCCDKEIFFHHRELQVGYDNLDKILVVTKLGYRSKCIQKSLFANNVNKKLYFSTYRQTLIGESSLWKIMSLEHIILKCNSFNSFHSCFHNRINEVQSCYDMHAFISVDCYPALSYFMKQLKKSLL
jgi:hypothetical protein